MLFGLVPRLEITIAVSPVQAERARLEALASFGGAALETVFVKHDGLRDKLRRQKEEALQAQCRPDDRAGEEGPGNSSECAVFDSSLGDLRVKKVDLKAKLKQEAEDRGKENMPLPPAKKSRLVFCYSCDLCTCRLQDGCLSVGVHAAVMTPGPGAGAAVMTPSWGCAAVMTPGPGGVRPS